MTSMEGFEAFYTALGMTPECMMKTKTLSTEIKSNPEMWVEEWVIDTPGGFAHRSRYIKGMIMRDSGLMPIGKDYPHKLLDGTHCRATMKMDSDTKMTIHLTGMSFEANVICMLTSGGNELTCTMTSGTASCTEKFKRLPMTPCPI